MPAPSRDAAPGFRSRGVPWGLAALLLALTARWADRFFHDDAYITLRYAARWLRGQGLSWTAGAPVEGFSHPLWLFQLAGLGALGVDLERAARELGLAYAAALVALWLRAGLWPAPLYALLLHAGFALWTRAGLETLSFVFYAVAGLLGALEARRADRRARSLAAGLLFAAAALTRPEGIALGLLGWLWIASGRSLRASAWTGIGFALPLLAYEAFRLHFYGDLLPNTAYVKLGGIAARDALRIAFEQLGSAWLVWAPMAALAALAAALCRSGPAWIALLFSAPIAATFLAAGGDHMRELRLLLPAIALWACGVGLAGRGARRPPLLGAACYAVIALHAARLVELAPGVQRDPAAEFGEPVGRALAERLPSGSLVALATAGSTPYFAPELDFIDTLGLNDAAIARRRAPPLETRWQSLPGHRLGDGAYVLSRAPDLIVLGPARGDDGASPRNWFLSDYELLQLPGFRATYRPYALALRPLRFPVGPLMRRRLESGAFRFVAYLRSDSPRVERLRREATPLRAPWDPKPAG